MSPDDEALVDKIQTHAGAANCSILTDQEIHRSRQILSSEKHILSGLDLEIRTLVAKRDLEQQQRITKFCIALAPHKRVPPELLSDIFFYCLPTANVAPHVGIPPNPSQAPWVLGQVCSLLAFGEKPVSTWITTPTGKACPASARSFPPKSCYLKIRGRVRIVTEIIIPHRWQELTPFRLARRLRSLKLDSPDELSTAFLYLDIPWSQLTSLDVIGLKGLSLSTVLELLQRCSSLESLNVRFNPTNQTSHFPEGSVPMHALRTLVMERSVPSAFIEQTDLWKRLATLNLQNVKFNDGRELHGIIKQCAGLTELIAPVPHKGPTYTTDGDLPLPHLTTLQLQDVRDTWIFRSLVGGGRSDRSVSQCSETQWYGWVSSSETRQATCSAALPHPGKFWGWAMLTNVAGCL